jgi:hypothetical protein
MPCQVMAARKDGNPPGRILLRVASDQRQASKLWIQSLTILGKHRTRLQDCIAEKSGEDKKDQSNNLKHHQGILPKASVNPPQFHRNMHHVQGVIYNGYYSVFYHCEGFDIQQIVPAHQELKYVGYQVF